MRRRIKRRVFRYLRTNLMTFSSFRRKKDARRETDNIHCEPLSAAANYRIHVDDLADVLTRVEEILHTELSEALAREAFE